jgi:hypothetical protein
MDYPFFVFVNTRLLEFYLIVKLNIHIFSD